MTLVAGVLLPDGVLLAADCRLTVEFPSRPRFVVDDVQKVAPLGESTAMGFSGDLRSVSYLFGQLFGPPGQGRRLDGVSIRRWLPRFFRDRYARLRRLHALGPCSFVVASTVKGRPQRVLWRDVARWAHSDERRSNYLLMRVWNKQADGSGSVTVPGSSFGLMYVLESPNFVPRDFRPLEFCAIGSGSGDAIRSMRRYASHLFSDHPGHAAGWFMEAMANALAGSGEATIGGMFVTLALANGEMRAMVNDTKQSSAAPALVIENGRFALVEPRTGRRILLRRPGECHVAPPTRPFELPHFSEFWNTDPPVDEPRFPYFSRRGEIEEARRRAAELLRLEQEELQRHRAARNRP